jgi:hypothetical protein
VKSLNLGCTLQLLSAELSIHGHLRGFLTTNDSRFVCPGPICSNRETRYEFLIADWPQCQYSKEHIVTKLLAKSRVWRKYCGLISTTASQGRTFQRISSNDERELTRTATSTWYKRTGMGDYPLTLLELIWEEQVIYLERVYKVW